MKDFYISALNTQHSLLEWKDAIAENMYNLYTPGYRESLMTFKTFLDDGLSGRVMKSTGQGKAVPGDSTNVFLEGNGFFVLKNDEGRNVYTRLGDFKFDGEGFYVTPEGNKVQGYILNDKGEIMSGTKNNSDSTLADGGTINIPTTEIKLWIDPDNGKYLGKYDEFEIKGDGILYGKANNGKDCAPLYKLAIMNFHNSQELLEYKPGRFLETEYSGKPVMGKGEVRGGLVELSNIDFKANAAYWKQANNQLDISNKLISEYKKMIEQALEILNK